MPVIIDSNKTYLYNRFYKEAEKIIFSGLWDWSFIVSLSSLL